MRTKLAVFTLFAAGLVLAATPALAGKPSSSSISLVLLASSTATAEAVASGPAFRDQVTFNVSTTATDRPQVNVNCYQNGAWVYSEWHGFFDGARGGQIFTLGPTPSWSGGAADCDARLVEWTARGRDRTLATMSFRVEA